MILIGIVLFGLFLRTYHFRDWLYFYPDQARDLALTREVVEGHVSWPLLGPIAASTPFRVGPMYYYFQIISGELFGVRPETMAYPDLLFGTLSIPLLFVLLRRYFTPKRALSLALLFAVSYFAIRYSRFAWNTNPIPFFSMLFFLALLEFLAEGKRTKWRWAAALGISIGVGIQLHTVLLILLPATALCVAGFLVVKKQFPWGKMFLVVVLVLLLNAPQIESELYTHFHNSRYFFGALTARSPSGGNGFLKNASLDIVCHAQAVTHLLTSIDGKDYCDTPDDLDPTTKHRVDLIPYVTTLGSVAFGLLVLLVTYRVSRPWFRSEADPRKRQFLGLIALYFGLSFLVIFPVMDDNAPMRYFLPTIFVPFIFLGLILDGLEARYAAFGKRIAVGIIASLVSVNLVAVGIEAAAYARGGESRSNYVVLGELERMRDYVLAHAGRQKDISYLGEQKFYQNYFKPFDFVFGEKGATIARVKKMGDIAPGMPLFYIADEWENGLVNDVPGHPVTDHFHIGHVDLYMLKN